jgi:hypothetical protein
LRAFFLALFRTSLGLASGLAVLWLGAWAGGALSPARAGAGRPERQDGQEARAYPNRALRPPRAPHGGELPPTVPGDGRDPVIPLGDSVAFNGQPMQLSIFSTRDAPGKVIEFYREAFEKRGLVPFASSGEGAGHVAIFDPEDGLQRFISAVLQADGETIVIVGLTNPRTQPRLSRGAQTAGFPVPEEHRGFLGYQAQDAGMRSASGQFVTKLTIGQVRGFYTAALAKEGYLPSGAASTASLLQFEKGTARLSVALQKLEEQGATAVFVSRTEGGGP